MRIGYALAGASYSVPLGYQATLLRGNGCAYVFADSLDAGPDRPHLVDALCSIMSHDVLVFFDINTLGRTVSELGWLIAFLAKRRVGIWMLNGRLTSREDQWRTRNLLAIMEEWGSKSDA